MLTVKEKIKILRACAEMFHHSPERNGGYTCIAIAREYLASDSFDRDLDRDLDSRDCLRRDYAEFYGQQNTEFWECLYDAWRESKNYWDMPMYRFLGPLRIMLLLNYAAYLEVMGDDL